MKSISQGKAKAAALRTAGPAAFTEVPLETFKACFEQAPLGVVIVDRNGRVVRVNRAFADYLGYFPDELVGKRVEHFTHPDDLESAFAQIAALKNREIDEFECPKRYLTKDGRTMWGRVRVSRVEVAPGADDWYVAHVLDETEYRRIAEEARVSESRFNELTRSMDEAVWIMDVEPESRMVFESPVISKIWGFENQEASPTTKRFFDAVHPDDRQRFLTMVRDARYRASTCEYRVRHADGSERWLYTRAYPIGAEEGRSASRIGGITGDITEARRIREELTYRADLESLLTSLATRFIGAPPEQISDIVDHALARLGRFTGAQVGYIGLLDGEDGSRVESSYAWVSDLDRSIRDGAVGWSLSLFPWFRAELGSLSGAHLANVDALPPDAAVERDACATWGIRAFSFVPILSSGALRGFMAFLADSENRWPAPAFSLFEVAAEMFANAFERRRAWEASRRHEAFERLVANLATRFINFDDTSFPGAVHTALGEIARPTRANLVALYVTDEYAEFAEPMGWWSAANPSSARRELKRVALRGDDPLVRHIRAGHEVLASDEEGDAAPLFPLRSAVAQLGVKSVLVIPCAQESSLVGFLLVGWSRRCDDVPDPDRRTLRITAELFTNAVLRLRAQEQLRAHEAALVHVHRLGTVGELAAGLAHELNQPLGSILGFAQGCKIRLESMGAAGADLLPAVEQIAEQARRAACVVQALRSHVAMQRANRAPHELAEVLKEALVLLTPEWRAAGVSLATNLARETVVVEVDTVQIQQVIVNLVRNAVDALKGVAPERREITVTTRLNNRGDRVMLSVCDSAGALDAADTERIFEPFVTHKSSGLGLGLWISRSLVAAHGGKLWATSGEGRTTFVMELPVCSNARRKQGSERG